jgi:protein gp37
MENTKIGWCTHTHNPWRGCTKVGDDCANCYAEDLAKRFPDTLGAWGPGGRRVVAAEDYWAQPYKWNRDAEEKYLRWRHECGVVDDARKLGHEAPMPARPERPRVFCASLCDVLEEWANEGRPRPVVDTQGRLLEVGEEFYGAAGAPDCRWWRATAKAVTGRKATMEHARLRLFDTILRTPHLNWLLLTKRPQNFKACLDGASGTVYGTRHNELLRWLRGWADGSAVPDNVWVGCSAGYQRAADERVPHLLEVPARLHFVSLEPLLGPVSLDRFKAGSACQLIHWAIVGGESGRKHRRCDPAWIADVVRQCDEAGVPVYVKQAAGVYPESQGDLSAELWARKEFPRV